MNMAIQQFQCSRCEARFSLNIETVEDEVDACCTQCQSTKIFSIVNDLELTEDCQTCQAGGAKFIGTGCGGGKKC